MTIKTTQFSLSQDTPQQIAGPHHMMQEVHIHNHEHSPFRDLYVGPDSSVSDSNGHHVQAGEDIVIMMAPGDSLWGMTPDAQGCDVTVMHIQRNN